MAETWHWTSTQVGGELMEFSEDVAPQSPPAAKIETGVEESVAPEAEPEPSADQPEPGGDPRVLEWPLPSQDECPS